MGEKREREWEKRLSLALNEKIAIDDAKMCDYIAQAVCDVWWSASD